MKRTPVFVCAEYSPVEMNKEWLSQNPGTADDLVESPQAILFSIIKVPKREYN